MTDIEDSFTNKVIAYGSSLLLHAVVIGVFMSLSGGSPAETAEDVEEEEVAEATPSPAEATPPPVDARVEPVQPVVAPVRPTVAPVKPPKPVVADKPAPPKPDPVVARPVKVAPPKPAAAEEDDGAQEMPAYHVVRQGETLTKIAALYNTTPQKLAKLNGKSLNAMNKLWVDQKVKLRK